MSNASLSSLRFFIGANPAQVCSLFRNPPKVGNKVPPPVQVATQVPCVLFPGEKVQGFSQSDYGTTNNTDPWVGLFLAGTDVQNGDQVHFNGGVYLVDTVAPWSSLGGQAGIVVARLLKDRSV